MSVQEHLNGVAGFRQKALSWGGVTTSRRVLVAYPGEVVRLGVNVRGPRGHVVKVEVRGLPADIAVAAATPEGSLAPFTSTIAVSVSAGAPPGSYPFELVVYDATEERVLGQSPLALLVLSRGLPRDFAKHYSKLRELYVEYGAMATIWHLLKHVFPNGATFTQLKQAYQLVAGRKLSNGTIGNTLKRMLEKKIVAEEQPGLYVANVKDFDIALSRIDIARVRVCTSARVEKRGESESAKQKQPEVLSVEEARVDLNSLPKPIERVWERAQEIAEE